MRIDMVQVKIHRAVITDAHLDYVGSITIGKNLIEASGLRSGQKVDIVDINNGERFSTYVLEGKYDFDIKINGAAARKVQIGDTIIIIAYASYNEEDLKNYIPKAVLVNAKNEVVEIRNELKGE